MIDQNQVIQLLQRKLNEARKENNVLKKQIEELKHQVQIYQAINLTVRRN